MTAESLRGNRFDRIWLGLLVVAGSALSASLGTTIFDVSVFLSGILFVGLIAIGRREGYLIGLYKSLSYSILAYANGLYGEVYLNLKAEKRYDLFFLCDTDIPYADTWDRSGEQKRNWFQQQIVGDLAERRVPFFRVSGILEERIAQVNEVLRQSRKFANALDIRQDDPVRG